MVTCKQAKHADCTDTKWQQWPIQSTDVPEGLQTQGICGNWRDEFKQIASAQDGTIGPTELHAYFIDDNIPKEMATKFRGAQAALQNKCKTQIPATKPKKNSEQELDTVQYAPCLVKLRNDSEIKQNMKSVHGIKYFIVSVVPANEMRKEK